ncbi:MAG: GAF domain-containing protein, partial [Acidobacteriota bacterium]
MATANRPLATRIRRLQEVTLRATEAPTIDEVARVIVDEGVAALDGAAGALWLLDGEMLELIQSSGIVPPPEYRRLPLSTEAPLARSVASRAPLWFRSLDEYAERFPSSAERLRQSGASELAVACLPLATGERALGGIVFAFDRPRELSEDERAFLVTIARQCASAIDRIRKARERERLEAENAQRALRLRKLQEVIAALSSAPTPEDIAAAMVRLGAEAAEAASCSIWARGADGTLHVLATHGSAACGQLCAAIVEANEERWLEEPEAFAGIPLDVGGRAIAALVFGYAG